MASQVLPVFEDGVFEDAIWTGVYTDTIDYLDLTNKRIHIKSGVTEYHPVDNIYKEVRFHRANDESLRVIDMPVESSGNIPKGGGKFTARLAIFKDGWKIVPANESHTLKVTGEQISDAGESGVQIMDLVQLDSGVNVSIEYAPPDTEVIQLQIPTNVITGDISTVETKLDTIQADLTFVKDIEGGKWEIVGSQMIFYKEDNITEIARFDIDNVESPTVRTRV